MNSEWQQQLLTLNARILENQRVIFDSEDTREPGNFIYPLTQLAILRVSGKDAIKFLQGQCTCNLNDLNLYTGSFGAFCNAKGRVISSFLIIRNAADWLLILPADLLPRLQKRLQMYILRADVQLTDCSNAYCLTGLQCSPAQDAPFKLPETHLAVTQEPLLAIRLGKTTEARYLLIADSLSTQKTWSDLTDRGFIPHSSSNWDLHDIYAGIPWLCADTSEEYIPQMLNLDQIGGVSFNKGCYTGQEIVARTHYLGKAKRAMFTARSELSETPTVNTAIIERTTQQIVGSVLATHSRANVVTLLVILAVEAGHLTTLCIQDRNNTPISVLYPTPAPINTINTINSDSHNAI